MACKTALGATINKVIQKRYVLAFFQHLHRLMMSYKIAKENKKNKILPSYCVAQKHFVPRRFKA